MLPEQGLGDLLAFKMGFKDEKAEKAGKEQQQGSKNKGSAQNVMTTVGSIIPSVTTCLTCSCSVLLFFWFRQN